tara:strand:+ start:148 stop:582 length:435 start_codon:yes stop_codon:yes gene_type:complete
MVNILCPHCNEEIGLDDDAFGEFSCPLCHEDFTWDGLSDDGDSAGILDQNSFLIGFLIPNLFVIIAFVVGAYVDSTIETGRAGDGVVGSLLVVSFLSWITILIYGISVKNKAIWGGALGGLILAPFVLISGLIWYLSTTNWKIF